MGTFLHWSWNGPSQIGNDSATQIAFARNRDARGEPEGLELFYTDMQHDLHHVRQSDPADSTSWQEQPALLGSHPGQTASAHQIAVGQNADGRLELIYVGTNGRLYRNRQVMPNSTAWEGESTPFGDESASQIAIGLDAMSRLELVYVGDGGNIYHTRQQSEGSAGWIGKTAFPGLSAKQIAVCRNPNNNNLLEVFYIGTNHGLYHIRQLSTNAMTDWDDGKSRFGQTGVKQLSVASNQDGRLEIFYVGTNSILFHNWQTSTADVTQWSGEARFPGIKADQVAVVQNVDGRLEIFYVGNNNGIYHNWQAEPNGEWLGEVRYLGESANQIAAVLNSVGRIETCYIGTDNHLFHNFQTESDADWVNENALGGPVASPAEGLGSNSNYFISSKTQLADVAVRILITEDLYCEAAGFPAADGYPANFDNSNHGLSWQLNCYALKGAFATWQQYGVAVSWAGGSIYGWVDNWKGQATDSDELINKTFHLCSINKKVPAGYELGIVLINDLQGNITGVTCRVIDNEGRMAGQETLMLTDHGLKTNELAPIAAFQLNCVGEYELETAQLATGSGEIVYAASTLMTVDNSVPSGLALNLPTGETANSIYSSMTADSSNVLTQNFGVTALKNMIRRSTDRVRGRRKPRSVSDR